MRLFKHKEKEEYFVSPDGDNFFAISDGNTYTGNKDTLKEIKQVTESKPVITDFKRHHIVEEKTPLEDFKDWHLKDVLFVPVDGKEVAFRVEHVTDDKVYFVAVDAVEKATKNDVSDFLKIFLDKMPKSLVKKMTEIEHLFEGGTIHKGKLTLLSCGNLTRNEELRKGCYGRDNMPFSGFMTDAEKCKNFDGETSSYWTDTPEYRGSTETSRVVDYCGDIEIDYNKKTKLAVVPCFSIYRQEK